MEHHDFPYIPSTKLPEVKRIASEYYDNLPYHTSWVKVLWDFIFDPDLGPHARAVGYKEKDVKEQKEEVKKQLADGCLWSHTTLPNGESKDMNGHSNGHSKKES